MDEYNILSIGLRHDLWVTAACFHHRSYRFHKYHQKAHNSEQDLLTVVGTLAIDPNGSVWNEWSRLLYLLKDACCSPYSEEDSIRA
jgi:hypothetical protein